MTNKKATPRPDPMTPEEDTVNFQQTLSRKYTTQLNVVLWRLRFSMPLTAQRILIDRFIATVAPLLSNSHGDKFPTTLRRHAVHAEKASVERTFGVLVFYIGDAILAYYEAVNTGNSSPKLDGYIVKFGKIADEGLDSFIVSGSIAEGYELVSRYDSPEGGDE